MIHKMEFALRYKINDKVYLKNKHGNLEVGLITGIQFTQKFYDTGTDGHTDTDIKYQVDEGSEWLDEKKLYTSAPELAQALLQQFEYYNQRIEERLEEKRAKRSLSLVTSESGNN